jgi:GT2 family glycosyltransferase
MHHRHKAVGLGRPVSESRLERWPCSPLFAVVMPAFDADATIDEAFESVEAQTFSAWEMAVVDDGSTDATLHKARRFAARDSRVRVISQNNRGAGFARARAVAATRAPYILQLDADDVLEPRCLETYAALIARNPSRDIYSCDAVVFGPHGNLGRYYDNYRHVAKTEFTIEDLIERSVILNPASVISRVLYDRIGGIRPDAFAEDYDLWLRALAHGGRHMMVREVLVRYRVGPSQRTATVAPFLEGAAESLTLLAASGALDDRLRLLAIRSARHYALLARRHKLEGRLCRGDLRDARREFLHLRDAYPDAARYAVSLSLVIASPRLYAAVLRMRRGAA